MIGCGLIGTSVALALREHGVDVHLDDIEPCQPRARRLPRGGQPEPAGRARPRRRRGAAGRASSTTVRQALEDLAGRRRHRRRQRQVRPAAAVARCPARTATSAATRWPAASGPARWPPPAGCSRAAVGRHAAAPDAADAVDRLVERWPSWSARCRSRMDAADHDRAVALVSHVPHILQRAGRGAAHRRTGRALRWPGPGLRDVTRIAGSDIALWQDILAQQRRRGPSRARARTRRPRPGHRRRSAATPSAGRRGARVRPGRHAADPRQARRQVAELATVFVPMADQPGRAVAPHGRIRANRASTSRTSASTTSSAVRSAWSRSPSWRIAPTRSSRH